MRHPTDQARIRVLVVIYGFIILCGIVAVPLVLLIQWLNKL